MQNPFTDCVLQYGFNKKLDDGRRDISNVYQAVYVLDDRVGGDALGSLFRELEFNDSTVQSTEDVADYNEDTNKESE